MATKHSTTVKKCFCKHEFQDKQYGSQMRLINITKHDGKIVRTIERCTVCGREEIK